jgi:hypothetical protein
VPDLPWTARAETEPGTGYLATASHLPLKRITATVRFSGQSSRYASSWPPQTAS